MGRKYNQFVNRKTRSLGSGGMDIEDKNTVKRILDAFGAQSIQFDAYVCINMEDHYNVYQNMTKAETQLYRKIRHPDVLAYFGDRPYIVEIDGKYHKDFDYDDDYEEIKVAYVKINKQFMKSEKLSWYTWIYNNLRNRWGIIS